MSGANCLLTRFSTHIRHSGKEKLAFNLKRNGIKFVLASIAVNAVIGIIAIVSGEFSELDAKILVTSLSVTGGSVLALANLAARTQQFVKYMPETGAGFAIIGFALLTYGAWTEFDSEDVGKAAGTAILFASGIGHAGLLSRSRLLPQYQLVLRSAWLFAGILVGMITFLIWSLNVVDNDIYPRAMGVVIILLAAATLAVPVLHRASKVDLTLDATRERSTDHLARYCPVCGSDQVERSEFGNTCEACGARFTVEFPA